MPLIFRRLQIIVRGFRPPTPQRVLDRIQKAKAQNVIRLDLSREYLIELPPEVLDLPQLKELDLSYNQLSSLPPEIGRLTNLQKLDLYYNQLSNLPPEIARLSSLQSLSLGNNQLSSLPPEIGRLTSLQSLRLGGNRLSNLPPEIGHLGKLQELVLGENRLSRLSPEIGRLSNLQKLNLYRNHLSSLPPEIGHLGKLQELVLGGNQLSSLPPEIGRLSNLQSLNLNKNQLSSLPPEIGRLTNLQKLYLGGNRLSSLPLEIGRLSNLQKLDLGNNQLSRLPPEIARLSSLQKLYLGGNRLSSLPPEIARLSNLQSLNLNKNQLSNLPPEIGRLTNLQSLRLYDNRLSSLLPEIAHLSNLQSLSLYGNQLSSLPPEIGRLTKLKELYLGGNRLSSLPPEIGRLSKLQALNLGGNRLSSLPPEIGRLSNLQQLDLGYNQLSSLPPEIGRLTSLQELDLSYNQLNSLPPEIGRLSKLQALNLSYNQLNSLPPEIGRLSNLQQLDLGGNRLSSLPPEIGRLSKLQALNLSFNQLSSLPNEVYELTALETLYLEILYPGGRYQFKANPIAELPPDILRLKNLRNLYLYGLPLKSPPPETLGLDKEGKADIAKLRRYFEEIERQGIDYLYEAKLLMVGEAGAGKTSLIRKIQNPQAPLPTEDDTTRGIDIAAWSFKAEGKNFKINLWDSGGQEIYHATHQFFLTRRSLYVLVADSRKEDTDFYHWLNTIEVFGNDSPVLIFNNKKGDRERDIDARPLRGRFENLTDILASNLKTDTSLQTIYPVLKHHLSRLPLIGVPLPKNWVRVRRKLEQDPRPYIEYREFQTICADHGLKDPRLQADLSEILHELGICLHFSRDILLKKWLILKPEWGTNAVYRVLDNEAVLAKRGRFNQADLARIWRDDEYAGMQASLLSLMINLKLCYEIPGRRGEYIVPQLLPVEKPDYTWNETDNLIVSYANYHFMPKGIITRFIVAMRQHIEGNRVWRSGVILQKGGARAEVIEHYTQSPSITLRVAGANKRGLLEIIMNQLDEIHASFSRLRFDKLVPCNCSNCKGSQTPYLYPFDTLRDFLANGQMEIQCQRQPYQMVSVPGLINDITSVKRLLERDMELQALLQRSRNQPVYLYIENIGRYL